MSPHSEPCAKDELGDLVDVRSGKRLPKGHPFSETPSGFPYVRVTDFKDYSVDRSNLRSLTPQDRLAIQRYVITSDDVYISIAGTTGLVGIVPSELDGANLTENAARLVVRDRSRLDNWFLAFYLSSPHGQAEIRSRTTKTSQPKLALLRIKEIPIMLPPLPEQRLIAHALRTLQCARQGTEKVIAATRQLKQSLTAHLFTFGPVQPCVAASSPTTETQIGPMPGHWHLQRFDDLFDSRLGKMLSPLARQGKTPRPYLRNANVQWGHTMLDDILEMDFDDGEREEFRLKPGDALICEGGEVGRTAIWRGEIEECYYQKAIHRARPRSGQMSTEFLMYHMMNSFLIRKSYGNIGTVTTIAHLPGVKLKALPIPVPPRAEQNKICHYLSTLNAKIASEEVRLSAHKSLFESLLHHLMTGKVRVHDLPQPEPTRSH